LEGSKIIGDDAIIAAGSTVNPNVLEAFLVLAAINYFPGLNILLSNLDNSAPLYKINEHCCLLFLWLQDFL
jgi:hypothetical protein